MNITTRKDKPIWLLVSMLLVIAAFVVLISSLKYSSSYVSAHSGDVFGPACGMATIDGNVDSVEWNNASTKTFQMDNPSGEPPFTATLHVINSGYTLYMGITINDDEFSTIGEFLPYGDVFMIYFDNDHSGSLWQVGEDVLGVFAHSPQFNDKYVYNLIGSNNTDINGGGTSDGIGAASRVNDLNHFWVETSVMQW